MNDNLSFQNLYVYRQNLFLEFQLVQIATIPWISFSAQLGMLKSIEVSGEEDRKENKTCLAACDTQLYSVLITNANYPPEVSFKYTKEFCFVVIKLLNSFENRRRVLKKSQPKLIDMLDILKVRYDQYFWNHWNVVVAVGCTTVLTSHPQLEQQISQCSCKKVILYTIFTTLLSWFQQYDCWNGWKGQK